MFVIQMKQNSTTSLGKLVSKWIIKHVSKEQREGMDNDRYQVNLYKSYNKNKTRTRPYLTDPLISYVCNSDEAINVLKPFFLFSVHFRMINL